MGTMDPFSGLGASQQQPQGPSQFDSNNIVGSSPEGGKTPGSEGKSNADDMVRKELSNLAKLKDEIESISKKFPGAASNLRAASEALNKALGDIVKQMRSEESSPKTAM